MKKIKEKLSEALEIPKEISMDYPKITLIGQKELYVENSKALISYTDTEIQLQTAVFLLFVSGKNLHIKQITGEILEIRGEILNMTFKN